MADTAKTIDKLDTLCQKWGYRFQSTARRVTLLDLTGSLRFFEYDDLSMALTNALAWVQRRIECHAYNRLNSHGTVGPWTAGGKTLDREMVNQVAVLIAQGYNRAIYIAFQLDLPPTRWGRVLSGCDRRLDRALQLLKSWGVIAYTDQGWEWTPEAVNAPEMDLPPFDPDAEVDFEEEQEHGR